MPSEGRICPQCSYQRQPKDLAPDYECPRCGIIYAKYKPPEPKPAPEEPPKEKPQPEDGEEMPELASPLRRALAGIYTFGLLVLYVIPLKLFVYGGFRLTHAPGTIDPWVAYGKLLTWSRVYYAVVGLMTVYAFLLRPWLDGRTWGQDRFGLLVRRRDDAEGSLSFRQYLLRFAGNLIALFTFPVTVGGLLYNLTKKRNDPGIADRLSETRQYAMEEPLPFRASFGKACFPLCVGLLLQLLAVGPLSYFIMKGYTERPRQTENKTARELHDQRVKNVLQQQMQLMRAGQPGEPAASPAQPDAPTGPAPEAISTPGPGAPSKILLPPRAEMVRQNSIRILTAMEKRQMKDRGSYTEDLEALVASYGAGPAETEELLKLIQQGTLRARKTVAGVELWLQNPNGEWTYEEVRK